MIGYIKRKLPYNLPVRKIWWKTKWATAYLKNSKVLDWIEIIWVTWTDWKTTTCSFTAQLFFHLWIPVAMMSTEQHFINWKWIENKSKRTTSSAFDIFEFIKKAKKEWVKIIILEVSSHALEQWRVSWIPFDYSVITNLSREHLDYHDTMVSYAKTKAKLLANTSKCVILPKNIQEKAVFDSSISCERIETFVWEWVVNKNVLIAKNLRHHDHWTKFDLHYKWELVENIFLPVIWDYNVENLLFAIWLESFIDRENPNLTLKEAIAEIKKVPWRLDELDFWQSFRVWNSFAVTPYAIEKLLKYAQSVKDDAWKVWIVYWATWWQHDHSKRPLMWEVTWVYADFSIITDDETYWEDSSKIIKEIEIWIIWTEWEYKVIPDRWEAISYALKNAKDDDIVIVTWMWNFTSRNVWWKEEEWSDVEFVKKELNYK